MSGCCPARCVQRDGYWEEDIVGSSADKALFSLQKDLYKKRGEGT